MAVWSEGYFTDIEYTNLYYRELSPLILNLNLTMAGFDIPCGGGGDICPKDDFSYLELAFGCGGSINIHAATMNGNFIGTDFNPAQVAIAKSYVKSANIALYDDSFKELLERFEQENPEFDYIVFHGIFSWISQENRNIILEIIRKFLKVGGVVYNSYNCMPGWSPKSPSRELLGLYKNLNHSAEIDTHTLVQNSLVFFENFLESKPRYAEYSPQNRQMLESLKQHDPTYVSHEYFNQNWDCFYFYQVAKMMEESKCSFATKAEFLSHFDGYNFHEEAITFLGKIQNRIFKEQLKDYYLNSQFRRDIYVKGVRRISQKEVKERLSNTYFVLLAPISGFKEKMQFGLGEASLSKDLYVGVLKFLETENYRAKSLREIIETCKIDFSLAVQVVFVLAQQAMVSPAQPVSKSLHEKTKMYNLGVLKKQESSAENSLFVAAPRIASALSISNVEQIVMHAYLQGAKKELEFVEYVMRIFKENNQGFIKDGKVLKKESETEAAIKEIIRGFLEKILLYKALGILE